MLPLEINSIAERTILTIEKPGVAVNALRFAKGYRDGRSRTSRRIRARDRRDRLDVRCLFH